VRLSAYVTIAALVRSDTARRLAIPNRPPLRSLRNLLRLARGLDRVRRLLGNPLEISSGYRSPALNREVGGSPRSRHQAGLAADFLCKPYGTPYRICARVARARIPFDQLIYEYGDQADGGWVHISFGRRARRQTLTIRSGGRGYRPGIRPCLRR
jgi:Peptidase M15